MLETIVLIIGICLIIGNLFMVYNAYRKTEASLQIQIEASKAGRNSQIINTPYKQLLEIVNDLINQYVASRVLTLGLTIRTEEEMSAILDDTVIEICTKVRASMSNDLVTALYFYITDEFLLDYIKDNVRLVLIARINSRLIIEKTS